MTGTVILFNDMSFYIRRSKIRKTFYLHCKNLLTVGAQPCGEGDRRLSLQKEAKIMRALGFGQGASIRDLEAKCAAISRSQAVIEFTLEGKVITANENFLGAMGYSLEEIVGKHHSMFCDPVYAGSEDYKNFWSELRRGSFQSAAYRRIAKGGRDVWIQASYNPAMDKSGKPIKVIKFATDITQQVSVAADHSAQVAAISRV
ncbi:MAG: PAS domain S-box protein, partial [Hyphomicrobiales bacterium]